MLSSWRTGTVASPLAGFHLSLEHYDGPFDLLVSLIETQGFDITTVSLIAVTSQYLDYVQRMEESFTEATAEFLAVASQLLLLKSRSLLPGPPEDDEEAMEAGQLAEQLRVYSAFRKLARELDRMQELDMPSFIRLAAPVALTPEIHENGGDLTEVVEALQQMLLDEESNGSGPNLPAPRFDLRSRIRTVAERLQSRGRVTFAELVAECTSKLEVVYTFLAALHLVVGRAIRIEQRTPFGKIVLIAVATTG